MLLALSWIRLILQADYKNKPQSPCMSCCVGTAHTPPLQVDLFPEGSDVCQNLPLGLMLLWLGESSFGCNLKPTTGSIASRSIWVGFRYKAMSHVVYNWPWVTCQELPHYSLFVASSIGSGCVWHVRGRGASVYKVWLPPA